ncbi:DDE-type integrase/transposase/recombinase [Vibrio cyclitrophicus]
MKKYRSYRGESGKAAPNVLERDFSATQPDEKWVTDVTEFKVKEQKVYLSPVVDLFTQEVVAYRVAKNACLPLVTDMLTEAISTLKPNSKPIIHNRSRLAISPSTVSEKGSREWVNAKHVEKR